MTITNKDIVLFQAQDNTDNDSGGGRRTSNQVVDGAVNNLFPDISRIDTVSGDVALRKVFPVINTDNRDIYYGAHAMLRKIPDDPKVSALLFFTDNPNDVRSEAQNNIESYVIASYEAAFYLYGNNIKGSKAVTWLQRETEQTPDVGGVYLIKEGSNEQYIRIANIEHQIVTLSHQKTDYKRRRIIAEIDQPLAYNFKGSSFDPDGPQPNTAQTFATQVADAAKFYGTKTLKADSKTGDLTVNVDSIYEQIVPASTKQTPIINVNALNQGTLLIPTGGGEVQGGSGKINTATNLPTPVLPGSFRLSNLTDDGNGNIVNSGGVTVGNINYKEGVYNQSNVQGGTVYYQPANVIDSEIQFTKQIKITQENQGVVFIQNVAPVPTSPDVYIDYRSGGRWYRISGNNDGTLGQDASIGAGLISDNGDGTATISVTLGANPDLDSLVIFSWGSDDYVGDLLSEADANTGTYYEVDLGNRYIRNSTFSIKFDDVSGYGEKTFTLDSNNKFEDSTNNIAGEVDLFNGKLLITQLGTGDSRLPSFLESSSYRNTLTFSYDYADAPLPNQSGFIEIEQNPNFVQSDEENGYFYKHTFDLNKAIKRESTNIVLLCERDSMTSDGSFETSTFSVVLRVNKNGIIVRYLGDHAVYGTVTDNGLITINMPKKPVKVHKGLGVWGFEDQPYYNIKSVSSVGYSTGEPGPYPNSYNETKVARDITTLKIETFSGIAGEVVFSLGEETDTESLNIKSKQGNLFDFEGNQRGTIDYAKGEMEIKPYENLELIKTYFKNLFTDNTGGNTQVKKVAFRTSATDLTTSSLILRYTTVNGTYLATTNANGEFTGTDINTSTSFVDTTTGAVYVEFTAVVNPASIKYDAVAETTLPLDPALLGLNPVRLPPNGKVPVFDPGRHLVIFHEETTDISGTPISGQTITLSRSKQSYVEIIDVNGARLAFDQYSADKENGTVTFSDSLSLVDRNGAAMTGPYQVVDRVEDMVLCTDAQVTGLLSISAPLTRDYPADETKIASALVWGDVGARYYKLFSQQTFNGWFDELNTDPITAQYDDVNYPIQINNKDSVAGRWMIRFTGSTTVEVVEETLGVVLQNININSTNVSPINPATNNPYWTMDFNGFGSGWVTGNVIRFNTDSGEENMWIIRTVQSGQLTELVDSIDVEIRGDAN